MDIRVPSEEEYHKRKNRDRKNFIGGLIVGFIFFGIAGGRIFLRYGFDDVKLYTWAALVFGVLAFGFLAKWFGSEFWQRIVGS